MASYADSRFGLRGYRCLVTGGSKGIGAAVVEELSSLGATVFTCARSKEDLDARLDDWRARGLSVYGCVADVSDRAQRESLVAAAVEALNPDVPSPPHLDAGSGGVVRKGLDLLINNVGFNIRKPTLEYTQDEYQRLMATNLESAYHLCQLCHPYLSRSTPPSSSSSTATSSLASAAQETDPQSAVSSPSPPSFTSSIIFNSSVAGGPTAMWSGTIYAMTKASMNQLAKNLACEWAKDGIRVNSVAPWYTATPLAQAVLKDEMLKQEVLDRTPMRRVGEPQEVAGVMAFLASKAASYVTGQTIQVDGGYSVLGYYRS